jgi:hypothetical protein
LADLQQKLDRTCLPSGITEVCQGGELFFMSLAKDPHGIPMVSFGLTIGQSLGISMHVH